MELMVYSTNKFNLSIIHRDGEKNISRAQYVLKYVQYIVENLENINDEFDLVGCINTIDGKMQDNGIQ